MLKKSRKLLIGLGMIMATMTGASPANAWYVLTFYDANGQVVGSQMYCDGGILLAYYGTQTDIFDREDHPGELPC